MENDETQYLQMGANLATKSLTFSLASEGNTKNGEIYVVSDNRYAVLQVNAPFGTIVCGDATGNEFPEGGLEKFIQERAGNENFLGITPLSQNAIDTIEKEGLTLYLEGIPVEPSNWTPQLYRKG